MSQLDEPGSISAVSTVAASKEDGTVSPPVNSGSSNDAVSGEFDRLIASTPSSTSTTSSDRPGAVLELKLDEKSPLEKSTLIEDLQNVNVKTNPVYDESILTSGSVLDGKSDELPLNSTESPKATESPLKYTESSEIPSKSTDTSAVSAGVTTEPLPEPLQEASEQKLLQNDQETSLNVIANKEEEKKEKKEEEKKPSKTISSSSSPSSSKVSSVTVTAQSESVERPVEPSYLISTLEKAPQNVDEVVPFVLSKLQAKSSKYKFIVLVTEFDLDGESQVTSLATFGAVWESSKDGFVSLQREILKKVLQVTLFWVYIN